SGRSRSRGRDSSSSSSAVPRDAWPRTCQPRRDTRWPRPRPPRQPRTTPRARSNATSRPGNHRLRADQPALTHLPGLVVPTGMFARLSMMVGLLATLAQAQDVSIDTSMRDQTIDGFGTCTAGDVGQQAWFQQLFFDELRATILRIDITPAFVSPYSDHVYNSPWY